MSNPVSMNVMMRDPEAREAVLEALRRRVVRGNSMDTAGLVEMLAAERRRR